MDAYQYYLLALTATNFVVLYLLRKRTGRLAFDFEKSLINPDQQIAVTRLQRRFLLIYVLISAADWLQGSFFYVVYRDTHGLPEATIGKLSATGFAAGAVSATFVGSLADRYGRKRYCIAYCLISSLSCLSVLVSNCLVLFVGRVLGGLATTLLYSVFEPWLLGELDQVCKTNELRDEVAENIFTLMFIFNGLVSIASGVISEWLIAVTGSHKAPFVASSVLLCCAAQYIVRKWAENYGEHPAEACTDPLNNIKDLRILWDLRTRRLAVVCFAFESSIFIIVYFWPAAITANARTPTSTPPLGMIFASFMSAMMLGSTMIKLLSTHFQTLSSPTSVLRYLELFAALALLVVVVNHSETATFLALCLFEACVGVYNPTIACLKTQVVSSQDRSKVYGLLRMPTNAFIVFTLSFVKEGSLYRGVCLGICSLLLVSGSLSITDRADPVIDEKV